MKNLTDLSPRKIIDPDGTLPEVELVPDEDEGMRDWVNRGSERFLVMHRGDRVGEAEIADRGDSYSFSWVQIDKKHLIPDQKRGFGLATYLAAIEKAHTEGKPFRTDISDISWAGIKVWNKFINKGIATVIDPFVLTSVGDSEDKNGYRGHAIIPLPENKDLHF